MEYFLVFFLRKALWFFSYWTGAFLQRLFPGISYFCIIVNGIISLILENNFRRSPIINNNTQLEIPAILRSVIKVNGACLPRGNLLHWRTKTLVETPLDYLF